MPKFSVLTDTAEEKSYWFYCPGCMCNHWVRVKGQLPRWTVTGLEENRPTVSPSILVKFGRNLDRTCHFFVVEGSIRFLSDCTHELAGKTVELEEFYE